MSTATHRRLPPPETVRRGPPAPPLHSGDRLKQPEFHRRYLAHPDKTKFELIDGVVYMTSPMRMPHASSDWELATILTLYKAATPGVAGGANATVILGDYGEPQPDHLLLVLPEFGGRSRTNPDGYVEGPPEWIAEVAHSTASIDLHRKKEDYRRAGVREYVVVCLEEQEVRWFDLEQDREWPVPEDGILRSRMFPGLWIDTRALLRLDTSQLVAILQQGLATPEHEEFVRRLEARRPAEAPRKRPARSRRKKPSPRKRNDS